LSAPQWDGERVQVRRKITLTTKLFYGAGSTAYGVKENGFRSLLLIFYNQVLGLPVGLVAGAITIALVFDAFLDPMIGQLSDMWRSRWGRRHPFMYAAAAPTAASFIALWNPPSGWSQTALLGYLIVCAVLVRGFITVYEIPSSALASELTGDYDERTALMSWRNLFFFAGGQLMTILMFSVFLQPTRQFPVGQLNPEGYAKFGWVAGLVILGSILISAVGTHGHIASLRKPPPRKDWSLIAVLGEMAATWSNRSFLMITAAGLFKSMALGISGALSVYFSTYFWQLSSSQIAFLVLDALVGALLAFYLTTPICKRFGKKPTTVFLLVFGVVFSSAPMTLRLLGWFFPNHSPFLVPFLFVHGAIFASMGIGATIATSSMIADVVEDSELKTGRRSEGLLFSASSMIQKCVSGVGVLGSGIILSTIHFPQHAKPGHVDGAILQHLALVYIPVLGALFVLSGAFTAAFRIDRRRHEENLRRLSRSEPAGPAPSPIQQVETVV
jgi:GPH family glycoside/pentoside/hexuronide:cation symporter